jgi:hypothetical protein
MAPTATPTRNKLFCFLSLASASKMADANVAEQMLIPVSQHAQQLCAAAGLGAGLRLYPGQECRMGRAVPAGRGNLLIPAGWVAFSSVHCVLSRQQQSQQGWLVEDRSTNGTYVNGERLARGKSVPLPPGAKLWLNAPSALACTNNPAPVATTLECVQDPQLCILVCSPLLLWN